jgi:hypothetical protein
MRGLSGDTTPIRIDTTLWKGVGLFIGGIIIIAYPYLEGVSLPSYAYWIAALFFLLGLAMIAAGLSGRGYYQELIPCPTCREMVSVDRLVCPSCGNRVGTPPWLK